MRVPKNQTWDNPRCEILKKMKAARPMSRQLCLTCKGGRLLCGAGHCPLLSKINLNGPTEVRLSESMFGPSPSVFVGWGGYPEVFSGPLTALESEDALKLDDPGSWYGLGFSDIIRMRSNMVRSKSMQHVRNRNKYIEENQELALSVKPTDIETYYKKKPSYNISFSPIAQPMGPSGELLKMRITENTKIPRKVDYIVGDELRAVDQVGKLYGEGFDVYYLTSVLSSGAFGKTEDKRLVPTRWSITAVDDILCKEFMKSIRTFPHLSDIEVYTNTYLENHFEILCLPGGWEFEQFESWAPQTLWTMSYTEPTIVQESEPHGGRWDYALNEGGGYYAGRFGVSEALYRMRRQARVVVFREIYDTYLVPVGVWEVRENVRKAMAKKPKKFATLREAYEDINSRLRIPIRKYVEKSEILRQSRLTDFVI